jgi:hypothetical protein
MATTPAGTIKRKVSTGVITTVADLCKHIRQVWGNCFRYNPYTDPTFVTARDLAEKFELVPTPPLLLCLSVPLVCVE